MTATITDPVISEAAGRIKARLHRSARDIIEIVLDLVIVKGKLGHGHFLEWIKSEFHMTDRTAQKFMSVFHTFGTKTELGSFLTPAVLYLLAAKSTTQAVRTEALKMIKEGKTVTPKTVTELRARLREEQANFGPRTGDVDRPAGMVRGACARVSISKTTLPDFPMPIGVLNTLIEDAQQWLAAVRRMARAEVSAD